MATLEDVIREVNALRPNQYDDAWKIEWLSDLDTKIYNDIIQTHQKDDENEFNGYTVDDYYDDLIVKEPYAELYKFYIMAMMDFYNGESARYQNSMRMFNFAYSKFERYYNRTHLPTSKPLKI